MALFLLLSGNAFSHTIETILLKSGNDATALGFGVVLGSVLIFSLALRSDQAGRRTAETFCPCNPGTTLTYSTSSLPFA